MCASPRFGPQRRTVGMAHRIVGHIAHHPQLMHAVHRHRALQTGVGVQKRVGSA